MANPRDTWEAPEAGPTSAQNGTVLYNKERGAPEFVPAAGVGDAIQSGKYASMGGEAARSSGGVTNVSTEDISSLPAMGAQLAPEVPAQTEANQVGERAMAARKEVVNNSTARAFTFAEGVLDAFSMGIIDDKTFGKGFKLGNKYFFKGLNAATGEEYYIPEDEYAKLGLSGNENRREYLTAARQDQFAGTRVAGEIAGTIGAMAIPGGPAANATKIGEGMGEKLAVGLLGEARAAKLPFVTRAAEEAGAGAMLGAVHSFNDQFSNALLEDKPFSAEAILHETLESGEFGGGLGFLGGLGKTLRGASRAGVAESAAITDIKSALSQSVHQDVRDGLLGFDEGLAEHQGQLGVLKMLSEEGNHVPRGAVDRYAKLVEEADAARLHLKSLDMDHALSGVDDAVSVKWRQAMEDYQSKLVAVQDESDRAAGLSRANQQGLNRQAMIPGPEYEGNPTQGQFNRRAAGGEMSDLAGQMHANMEGIPGAMDAYQNIYGRPYEPPPELGLATKPFDDVVSHQSILPAVDQAANARAFDSFHKSEIAARASGQATGAMAAEDLPMMTGEKTAVHEPALNDHKGRPAVQQFLDNWHNKSQQMGPRVSPADRAAAKLANIMDRIKTETGGALDSAGALDIFKAKGLEPATTSFGSQIDQLVAARQLARVAADASRGNTEVSGKLANKWMLRWLGSKAGYAVGGPLGSVMGVSLANQFVGTTARIAGATASLGKRLAGVVDDVLKGGRATVGGRALVANAKTIPSYSEAGPIADPVQRIQELQRVAANPEALRAYVIDKLGAFADTHPDVAGHVADLAVARLVGLSIRAPALYFDTLGKPGQPESQILRRWEQFERASNDLDGVLRAITKGVATEQQIDALRTGFPGAHQRLVTGLLSDQEALKNLSRNQLRNVEQITGMRLSVSGDPGFVARQIQAWQMASQPPPQAAPANQHQISGSKLSGVQETPANAAVAPGNR